MSAANGAQHSIEVPNILRNGVAWLLSVVQEMKLYLNGILVRKTLAMISLPLFLNCNL